MSDTSKMEFRIRVRMVEYGDKRKFAEYKIAIKHRGQIVGLESGRRRSTALRAEALKAARARVRELRARRLFAVRVTRKHIRDGEARSCFTCAIAQALFHNQERMGFPKRQYDFEVSPYGGFGGGARGIVITPRMFSDQDQIKAIPADALPTMVCGAKDMHGNTMMEWAMLWDDWAESRTMSLAAWREKNAAESDERPWKPGPAAFVLDLDAFQPVSQ